MIDGIVYKGINKVTGQIYIGQTKKGIKGFNKRKADHKWFSCHGFKGTLYESIRQYGWENFDWSIIESNIPSHKMLDEMEYFWISTYQSNIKGLNISPGGHKLSDEGLYSIRVKNSLKRVNLSENIVSVVKEDLAKGLGMANLSRKYEIPYTTIREIKGCNIWAWVRDDLNNTILNSKKLVHRRKIPHKGVQQIDPETQQVIQTFTTLKDAEKATGALSTNISKCCKNMDGYKTAGGYQWRYFF